MPVNREELLAKLAKMGLSKTNMYRMNHGIVAVEEFVASETIGSIRLHAEDATFDAPGVEETIQHVCPKCEHAWATEETFFGDDARAIMNLGYSVSITLNILPAISGFSSSGIS